MLTVACASWLTLEARLLTDDDISLTRLPSFTWRKSHTQTTSNTQHRMLLQHWTLHNSHYFYNFFITRSISHVKSFTRWRIASVGWSQVSVGKPGCKVQFLDATWTFQGWWSDLRWLIEVGCSRLWGQRDRRHIWRRGCRDLFPPIFGLAGSSMGMSPPIFGVAI